MSTTFENAQVGDKVYSLHYGWGTIENIQQENPFPFFFIPNDDKLSGFPFNEQGFNNYCKFDFRDVYHSEPEIIAPEQPKRTVNKVMEAWVIVFIPPVDHKEKTRPEGIDSIFQTFQEAKKAYNSTHAINRFADCYKIVKFTSEPFEVEE